jgi:hypothetical protein
VTAGAQKGTQYVPKMTGSERLENVEANSNELKDVRERAQSPSLGAHGSIQRECRSKEPARAPFAEARHISSEACTMSAAHFLKRLLGIVL